MNTFVNNLVLVGSIYVTGYIASFLINILFNYIIEKSYWFVHTLCYEELETLGFKDDNGNKIYAMRKFIVEHKELEKTISKDVQNKISFKHRLNTQDYEEVKNYFKMELSVIHTYSLWSWIWAIFALAISINLCIKYLVMKITKQDTYSKLNKLVTVSKN